MDEETSGVDIDDDYIIDEGDTSEDDELMEDSEPSPFQQAVSPEWSQWNQYSGKPLDIRRGRGRPRKDKSYRGAKATSGSSISLKIKRWKTSSARSSIKRSDSVDTSSVPQSPSGEGCTLDPETGALIPIGDSKQMLAPEEPYFPEQWPGKVCAFCNLGERSQLGQGELIRLTCPEGFKPTRSPNSLSLDSANSENADRGENNGDKSPRAVSAAAAVTCRRQKSLNKCRNPSLTNIEYVDELTIIGHPEEPDVSTLFDSLDFYVHNSCAIWSSGVTRCEDSGLENIGPVVLQSISRKCASCNHFGASMPCRVVSCTKFFHFPCAAASGAFQDIQSYTLFCNQHLGQVPLQASEDITCMTCYALGDVANLVMCSSCGRHHHGTCVGLAQLPGVRAGWQCRDCRNCQICRQPGDESKLMSCELCDKVYHPQCLRPIVTSIPKYGWKCKCCRICTDCGSRTPGAGLSSRWHAHFTVCDSCYQQRNKGFSCPLCHRAYRAAAYREMVQCSSCHKFVHGTCDGDADSTVYQKRKEANPEYEYVCTACKEVQLNSRMAYLKRKNSFDDSESNLSASQESLNFGDDPYDHDIDNMVVERAGSEDSSFRALGFGKGKPFLSSKLLAKKRMGFSVSRPKGIGKHLPSKFGYQKRKTNDFGRKRGPKGKIRNFFGGGVCLEKPSADSTKKEDEEPGVENRLVLCSAKDRFVLTQDICVMCGALGTDQEGCLIACAQCGQCYHPYCVNVKVTKVILEKGWRCLDCTVCEGCGNRNDESLLILCDDCDISYHTYCMDPPLEFVPRGNWKCKWCALCQTCGASDPGFNCSWMSNFTECGPCHSLHTCPNCSDLYNENELIIKCMQCERWLHCKCDSIKTEQDAERCADEGYSCVLCRPRDEPPPHLIPPPPVPKPQPPSPKISPPEEPKPPRPMQYYVDGVYLSEVGMQLIRSLGPEQQVQRKKRRKGIVVMDKEAGIRATIESVVAGGSLDNSLDDTAKLELVDIKDEPTEIYKEGMTWIPKTNGTPPEGFTVYTTENGMMVLRKKRQRNLQKLGIGGFIVRNRINRPADNDEIDTLPGQTVPSVQLPDSSGMTTPAGGTTPENEKPRKKPIRRKNKSKLIETFPSYIQDAFFGRELLDTSKEKELESSSDSEDDHKNFVTDDKTIELNQDEIKAIEAIKAKQEPECTVAAADSTKQDNDMSIDKEDPIKEEDGSDTEALKDVLELPGDLLDTDLVKSIMNEDDLSKTADSLDLPETNIPADSDLTNPLPEATSVSSSHKDDLSEILNSHFNLPNMDSKDVEEIFKGVLTEEPQESQDPIETFPLRSAFPPQAAPPPPIATQQIVSQPPIVRPPIQLPSVGQNNMNSPMSFPPPSPYHSEYSNSPQFSPAFSEPPSPWIGGPSDITAETVNEVNTATPTVATSSYNQRSTEKMKADEALGNAATISAVLYANINHPEWKTDFPVWADRYKQILKKWRALSADKKAPYLQQARDNRSAFRMKKAQQQITKDTATSSGNNSSTTTSTSQVSTNQGGVIAATTNQVVGQVIGVRPTSCGTPGLMQTNTTVVTSTMSVPMKIAASSTASAVTTTTEVCNWSHGGNTAPSKQLTIATSTATTSSVTMASSLTSTSNPIIPPHSKITTQQFTVHHQYPATLGSISHSGPAPNVTVNPHYNPHLHASLSPSAKQLSQSTSSESLTNTNTNIVPSIITSDQQIRVLTPSEIMRTLPSLSQDSYDTQAMDQDKLSQQQKSVREAEQERQWKQLQATRQQQAQQQQQVIHDQRLQAIVRVRQMTEGGIPGQQYPTDQVLQVNTQDGNTSPSQQRSPFTSPAIQANRNLLSHSPNFSNSAMPPPRATEMRPQTLNIRAPAPMPAQSPSPFSPPTSVGSDGDNSQDPYMQNAPKTPFMMSPQRSPVYSQISNSKPQFNAPPASPRSVTQVAFVQPNVVAGAANKTQDNQQLRDLLQRQQFKKLDEQILPGQQRIWSSQENTVEVVNSQNQQQYDNNTLSQTQQQIQPPNIGDATFRQPLPPALVRTRAPVAVSGTIARQFITAGGPRQPQTLDPRMKLLIQQQQRVGAIPGQQTVTSQLVTQGIIRPTLIRSQESFDPQLVQRQQQIGLPSDAIQRQLGLRLPQQIQQQKNIILEHRIIVSQAPPQQLAQPEQIVPQTSAATSNNNFVTPVPPTDSGIVSGTTDNQEIPDSVTAELEKLEQEGGGMVEVEGVGDILGGLGEDDDELLAEMGADFNILEYADPELDALTGGEKTNILDSLDLEEPESDKEDTKLSKPKDEPADNILSEKPTDELNNQSKEEIPDESLQSPVERVTSTIPTTLPPPPPVTQLPQTELKPTVLQQNPLTVVQQTQQQPQTLPEILTQQRSQTPQTQIHQHVIQRRLPSQQQQLQIQHQMHQQVQNEAAMGRPMAPGTRLVSQDGAVGIVQSNNTVSVSYPNFFPQDGALAGARFISGQLAPQARIQMRMATPRLSAQLIQHAAGPRLGAPPPPPPPYPGPPPPYPGSAGTQQNVQPQQISQQMGGRGSMMPMHPMAIGVTPPSEHDSNHFYSSYQHFQRRPLLLQEQPLLLEDLLEQEKREQEKQMQNTSETIQQTTAAPAGSLLSDQDFERLLRTDVLGKPNIGQPQTVTSTHGIPAQGLLPTQSVGNVSPIRPPFQARQLPQQTTANQWQNQQPQTPSRPQTAAPDTTTSVPPFNIPLLPAPPLPPEHIVTEQDRQTQMHYQQWLNHQNQILTQQLKYYETEVLKLRKIKKSLNSKQRQLRKSGNELSETDAFELQRVSSEQAVLQKQLESSRKQSRQHGMLIQEYQSKHQAKQQPLQQQIQSQQSPQQSPQNPNPQQVNTIVQSMSRASPVHHTPTSQSPLMSPTQSPMMAAHNSSPMHSPGPMIINSPGPVSSVNSILQSPGHQGGNSMSPHTRIGTPHSQTGGDESPFSPGASHSPSATHRMSAPGRHVTSPGTYTADIRPGTPQFAALQQNRFMRPSNDQQVQRQRLQLQNVGFQQGIRTQVGGTVVAGGRSPLASPQPITSNIVQSPQHSVQSPQLPPSSPQQILQRQAIQQVIMQQNVTGDGQSDNSNLLSQSLRTVQLVQQRQLTQQQQQQIIRQQLLQQQQQLQQQSSNQQQHLTNQQLHHQQLLQQQLKQQIIQQKLQLQNQHLQNQQTQNQQLQNQQLNQQLQNQQIQNQQLQNQQLQNQQLQNQQLQNQQLQNQQLQNQQLQNQQLQNQPPSSPLAPPSPMIANQQNQQTMLQIIGQKSPSHAPPRSPMVSGGIVYNQPPNSPMPRSPMLHQVPPSSPMLQQQLSQQQQQQQQNQPPSSPMPSKSPMPRSPMISGSPMQIMRPPSTNNLCSPLPPDRPQSVENPSTPRTPFSQSNIDRSENHSSGGGGGGGGGNSHPIPFPPPGLFTHGRFKLGLRGGAPMWSYGKGTKRIPQIGGTSQNKDTDKPSSSETGPKIRKESHISKVSILKKKSPRKIPDTAQILVSNKVGSLVCAEYNEFDDSSSTPPISPPPLTSTSSIIEKKTLKLKIAGKKAPDDINESGSSSVDRNVLVVDCSPGEKSVHCNVDFDDDNDKTLVASEISLNSVAQEDIDDMTVVESFSQQDLANVISSPLETGVAEEYVLFSSDMVGDISVECDDSLKHLETDNITREFGGEIEILNKNVEILSQTSSPSDDIILSTNEKELSIELFSDVVADTPESPDQNEVNIDPSSPDDLLSSLGGSEIVVIDQSVTSPEEHIATTEDFEELIDGEKREDKIHRLDARHILEIHKYASSPLSYSSNKTSTNSTISTIVSSGRQNKPSTIIKKPIIVTTSTDVNKFILTTTSTAINPKNTQTSSSTKVDTPIVNILRSMPVTVSNPQITEIISSTPRMENTLTIKSASPSIMTTIMNLSPQDTALPSKIFQDESGSPEESGVEENNEPDSPIEKYNRPPILEASLSSTADQAKTAPESTKIDFEEEINAHSVSTSRPKISPTPITLSVISSVAQSVNYIQTSKVQIGGQLATILTAKPTKIEPQTENETSEVLKINTSDIMGKKSDISTPEGPLLSVNVKTFPGSESIIDENSEFEPKSVEISIPSPTPSQEKMLDNLARQALEVRGREDKPLSNDFQTIEDMLDMIENITSESKLMSEIKHSGEKSKVETITHSQDSISDINDIITNDLKMVESESEPNDKIKKTIVPKTIPEPTEPISVTTSVLNTKQQTIMPQLSPLSQPAELTTNMANVSQQLRTFMSSLSANSITTSSSIQTEKLVDKTQITSTIPSPTIISTSPITTSRIVQHPSIKLKTIVHTSVPNTVIQNTKQKQRTSPIISPQRNLNSSPKPTTTFVTPKITSTTPILVTQTMMSTEPTTSSNFSTVLSTLSLTKPTFTNIQKATTTTQIVTTAVSLAPISQVTTQSSRVCVPSLNELLQSHPAATIVQTVPNDSITTASILASQTLGPVMSTRPGLVSSRPSQIIEISKSEDTLSTPKQISTSTTASILGTKLSAPILSKAMVPTTNLLHTHLTKTPLKRVMSTESAESSNTSVDIDHKIKSELEMESKDTVTSEATSLQSSGGCKYSTLQIQTPVTRVDDSQNVLLKQLLQNTGCATSSSNSSSTNVSQPQLIPSTINTSSPLVTSANNVVSTSSYTTSSITNVPSLEAQLARPVPPTHSPLLPPLIQPNQTQKPPTTVRHSQIMSRETSFVSRPVPITTSQPTTSIPSTIITQQSVISQIEQHHSEPPPVTVIATSSTSSPATSSTNFTTSSQQLFVEVKRGVPPVRSISRDELLSPPSTKASGFGSNESSLQTPPIQFKRESFLPESSPISNHEVKKEILDESSQHSSISSDVSKLDLSHKEESSELTTPTDPHEKTIQDALFLKRIKRRQYQQKRRQLQIQAKEAQAQQPKKRARKMSKLDEDYDVFNDNLMAQIRQLPPMVVMEPILGRNYNVCPVWGSGDLTKIGNKNYNTRTGDLAGSYGNAYLPGVSDYYNTKPFGLKDPLPEKPPVSTQRGFYDQEFEPIKFNSDDSKRLDLFFRERDDDVPDTIINCTSPNCCLGDKTAKHPGLSFIRGDEDDTDEEEEARRRMSPEIPIIAPIPIRLKSGGQYLNDYDEEIDKENQCIRDIIYKSKSPVIVPPPPLKDSNNVTVTLTLTSSAAEDIMGVLRDLANILHIPPPTGYQIVERTTTPPSQKLGLYRTKGKDGKEGAPIDIQSVLNGAAKFCRHCDVVILNTMIRKKVSDLPFLAKDSELLLEGDELYFCSSSCYMQFALMHRSPNMPQEKAAAIIDHLSQNDKENQAKIMKRLKPDDDSKSDIAKEVDNESNKTQATSKTSLVSGDKKEMKELSISIPSDNTTVDRKRKLEDTPTDQQPVIKSWKGMRYKTFKEGTMHPDKKYKRLSEKEMTEYMFRLGVTVMPAKIPEDTRKCMFCHMMGDGTADGPARLLNFDVDKWVHLNCALWSDDVYETVNGALMNLENALQQSLTQQCVHCQQTGATIRCFKVRCSSVYHLACAVKDNCVFYKNKTVFCAIHALKNEKENELTTLSVYRRVYVNRDENRQVAAVMHHSDQGNLLRVGSLIFLNVGQILPHQLQNFHNQNYIYPIGYKIVRFYWSMRRINKRCRYVCSIHDVCGRPEFRVLIQEPTQDDLEMRDASPRAVWQRILDLLDTLRRENNCVHVFPRYITGEDLFGLTEPAIVRVLESLPGIETLTDYRFKYGRNPLLELPLAINPSGAARTEPRLKNALPWKRPHTQRTASSSRPTFVPSSAPGSTEAACPYSKQFVHSKSSQYKKMKQEWRNNVYLARSKIQGLGLYATRDLEKHTMVIEYIGEVIRTELAELREKQYEARNRGIYMFRLDDDRVVDATLCGGLARYINHSCNPNCVAEIVEVDRDLRIIIFAKRRINRGEELAYDYKFDIEDDQHKISCMCGAPNCRKWMN